MVLVAYMVTLPCMVLVRLKGCDIWYQIPCLIPVTYSIRHDVPYCSTVGRFILTYIDPDEAGAACLALVVLEASSTVLQVAQIPLFNNRSKLFYYRNNQIFLSSILETWCKNVAMAYIG